MQIIASKVEQQQSEYQLASKVEQQQIENEIQKKNFQKDDLVIEQKLYCHFCPTKTEIITKEFFYKFADGKAVFFCNTNERDLWMKLLTKKS